MTTLSRIIYIIDVCFSSLIFIPAIFVLYYNFTSLHKKGKNVFRVYLVCLVMIGLFIIKIFCSKFIFTDINYPNFVDSGLFWLIKVLFYPNYL